MARVLLTGARGFIGRHVRAALAGHEVKSLGRSEPGGDASIRLDLATSTPSIVAREIDAFEPDAVINCAGATEGSEFLLNAANVTAVATLLEAMRMWDEGVRFVQVGSAAEHAVATDQSADGPPPSAYGTTKLAATQLVLDAAAAGTVDGIVVRLFNPVGAGMSEATLPGRAAAAMREALATASLKVSFGPLTARRDFVDARDAAAALAGAALADRVTQRVVECGSGSTTLVRDLVRMLADIAGYGGEIVEETTGSPRSAGVRGRSADTRALEELAGWRPRHSLGDALEALWNGAGTGR